MVHLFFFLVLGKIVPNEIRIDSLILQKLSDRMNGSRYLIYINTKSLTQTDYEEET